LQWGRLNATWHLWQIMDNDAKMLCGHSNYELLSAVEWYAETGVQYVPLRNACPRCEAIIDDVDMSDL
jgi:hypothetical protein